MKNIRNQKTFTQDKDESSSCLSMSLESSAKKCHDKKSTSTKLSVEKSKRRGYQVVSDFDRLRLILLITENN